MPILERVSALKCDSQAVRGETLLRPPTPLQLKKGKDDRKNPPKEAGKWMPPTCQFAVGLARRGSRSLSAH